MAKVAAVQDEVIRAGPSASPAALTPYADSRVRKVATATPGNKQKKPRKVPLTGVPCCNTLSSVDGQSAAWCCFAHQVCWTHCHSLLCSCFIASTLLRVLLLVLMQLTCAPETAPYNMQAR